MSEKTSSYEKGTTTTYRKFVLFAIGEDVFGVPVEQVSNVTKFDKAFPVPGTPDYVLGVINLRGRVLSLIHLKKRLGLGDELPAEGSGHIIFVDLGDDTIGMLVDRVLNLRTIPTEQISENLDLISSRINMDFLKGAAMTEEDIVILINLDMVLAEYEVEEVLNYRKKLEDALEVKDKVHLTEQQLHELNLEKDDFELLGDRST